MCYKWGMGVWDILSYIGLMVVLAAAMYFIHRMDKSAKAKSRENAYRLLDMEDPPPRDLKRTIRDLSLYGGRLKRDKEFLQLKERLNRKLEAAE
jgi:hypothetical protein